MAFWSGRIVAWIERTGARSNLRHTNFDQVVSRVELSRGHRDSGSHNHSRREELRSVDLCRTAITRVCLARQYQVLRPARTQHRLVSHELLKAMMKSHANGVREQLVLKESKRTKAHSCAVNLFQAGSLQGVVEGTN